MSGLLKEWRIATAHYHSQLEQELNLLQTIHSDHQYIALLKHFHGLYCSIETFILTQNRNLDVVRFYDIHRQKRPALVHDLRFFGMNISDIENLPHSPLPIHSNVGKARFWGWLYVLEGATLGGQVISKHFKSLLNLSEEQGLQFFAGYRSLTSVRWKEFLEVIHSLSFSQHDHQEAVDGAIEIFELFRSWFALR